MAEEKKKDDLLNFYTAFKLFLAVAFLGSVWALSAMMPAWLAFVIVGALAFSIYKKVTNL